MIIRKEVTEAFCDVCGKPCKPFLGATELLGGSTDVPYRFEFSVSLDIGCSDFCICEGCTRRPLKRWLGEKDE